MFQLFWSTNLRKIITLIIGIIGGSFLLLIIWMNTLSDEQMEVITTELELRQEKLLAQQICRDYESLLGRIIDGNISESKIKDRAKQIQKNSESANQDFQTASVTLISAINIKDADNLDESDMFMLASERMVKACQAGIDAR